MLKRRNNLLLIFLFFLMHFTKAQTVINGEVLSNEDNQPLTGVSVKLLGTSKGVATNNDGKFTLTVTADEFKNGTLQFSDVGYKTKDIRINGRTSIRVILNKNLGELGEVVINAYTRPKRKEEVVGSLSTITGKELQTLRPIESFDKMLEGMVAGVQVETNTELGTPVKINIRGQNSLTPLTTSNRTVLTTSSQPLFIIDGVPVIEQRRGDEPIAFINNEELLNPIAGINPDDIESITVLKDAAATAIYGANASNGVIIITTKKGKAGKPRVNVGYSGGFSQPINQIKWLSGPQYYELLRELYINEGRAPFDAELLAGSPTMNTNWFGLTNQYGKFTNLDFDISGGTEALTYRFSASWLDQQAIQRGNDFKKAYIRLRVDHQLNKKMNVTFTMAPTITMKNAVNIYGVVPMVPNIPAYNADGSFYETSLGVPNPLAVINQNLNYHEGGTMNGKVEIAYKILPNLRFTTSFGVDALINKLNNYRSGKNATGRNFNGFAEIYDRTNFGWINFNQLSYNTKIKGGHELDVTAGFELQSQLTKLLRGQGSGFTYYRLNELSNAERQNAASSKQRGNSVSIYSQAGYNFNKRYFITASARYDAASVFGTDVNATVNGALGFGWTISNEKWFAQNNWLNLFRARLSYGTTGNSRIGSYEAKGLYTFSNTGYNGFTSSDPSTPPNPDLTWEKAYKWNGGVDFNFLKRFNVTVDFYRSTVDNAISLVNVPVVNGFTSILENTAKMRNQGMDFTIQTDNIKTSAFGWTTTLVFGFNQNKILSVKNNSERYSTSENATALRAGISTGAIWGFKQAGVDPQTGMELFYDKGGKIVPADQLDINVQNAYFLGNRLPKVQGGLVNSVSYKGFFVTVNFIYSIGGYEMINYRNENNGRNLDNRNQSVNMLDRWQKPGDITTIPRLSRTTRFVANSSRFMYENTFLKLSNVTINYTLPKKWADKVAGIRATVFANGTNLWYWYKQKSPNGRNGIREYRFDFPEAQSFTWGIRANF